MKDTIGAHLAASMQSMALAQAWREAGYRGAYLPDTASRKEAQHEGAAAGHAFRAAELAYEMGRQNARIQCDECHEPKPYHAAWCGT